MNVLHISVMDLSGDPGNPLYAVPLSMAENFDAMTAGARAIGELLEVLVVVVLSFSVLTNPSSTKNCRSTLLSSMPPHSLFHFHHFFSNFSNFKNG